MSNFDKYSNYDESTSFSGVVFGANAPILEVELNEMQQITDSKIVKLGKLLGAGYYPLKDGDITISGITITIKGGIIVTPSGLVAEVKDVTLSATLGSGNNLAYFEVTESVATPETALKNYGSVKGSSIANPIIDSRFGAETSRRRVVTYAFKAGTESKLENENCVGVYRLSSGSLYPINAGFNKIQAEYARKDNAEFTGSISLNKKSGTTMGKGSIAIGTSVEASENYSSAFGNGTIAKAHQMALGNNNDSSLATENSSNTGTALVVGNGTVGAKSNAFRVLGSGVVYAKGAYNATGADYAEYAEWADGNPDNEDRRGYFVTFDEEKPNMIRKAKSDDIDILGVVSGNPCVIGNSDECWTKKFLTDDFGNYLYETVEEEVEIIDPETEEVQVFTQQVRQYILNPDFNEEEEYVHRSERPEWSAVGWIGVLPVREDGTCEVGGYCTYNDDGIATSALPSRYNYRVVERVTENVVKVVIK